jgi:hypothetical protein
MKKFTLPAISLAFMISFNSVYGSTVSEESNPLSTSTNKQFNLKIAAGSYNTCEDNVQIELSNLKSGIISFSKGDYESAKVHFNNAIEYGSPLAYLYAGVLANDVETFERYIEIAALAVEHKALSQHIFDQHVDCLVKTGFLTQS